MNECILEKKKTLKSIRDRIIAVSLTLVGIGVVLVYSASCVKAGNAGFDLTYLKKQLIWLAIGLVTMGIMSFVNLQTIRKFIKPIFLLIIVLLVVVLTPGIGTRVNGASRWLRFAGFNMQPSEIAKILMVFVMSATLAKFKGKHLPFWKGFVPAVMLTGMVVGLIMLEPDFGTSALIGAVMGSMIVVGGARLFHTLLALAGTLPPGVYLAITKMDYIASRINAWLSGDKDGKGYQIWMSKVALGSGGVTGMGLGEGVSKLYYLPEAHTDFILAIAGQELGLVGTIGIVLLFSILVYEGMRLVKHAPDKFTSLVAYGIVAIIGLQAAFNIAVVTASIPPKGISLPFISFGGSGLCVALAMIGTLVSITRIEPDIAVKVVAEPVIELGQVSNEEKDVA